MASRQGAPRLHPSVIEAIWVGCEPARTMKAAVRRGAGDGTHCSGTPIEAIQTRSHTINMPPEC